MKYSCLFLINVLILCYKYIYYNPFANAGDTRDADSTPEPGRCSGIGNGIPFQYSCLENSTDRLQFMRPQRVRHDWATEHTHTHTYTHTPLVQRLAPPASIKHTFPSPCICVETIYLANQSHPLGPKCKNKNKNKNRRTSLEVQWLRFCASTTRAQVWYLVRELRSHVPCI